MSRKIAGRQSREIRCLKGHRS